MSEIQVQVIEGRAWEPTRKLSAGVPMGPIGLGSAAEWVIDGQGVGPIHAYLYYDGNVLMAATAPPHTTHLNGAPISSTWTPLTVPCELSIGGARIKVQQAAPHDFDDAATNAVPPQEIEDAPTGFLDRSAGHMVPAPRLSGGTGVDRQPLIADDSTKFLPIEKMHPEQGPQGTPAVVVSPDALRPDPSKIAMTIAPGVVPTPQIEPPPQPDMGLPAGASPAPSPAAGGPLGKLKEAWQTASPPKRITYILAPFALVAFGMTMLDDEPPATKGTKSAKPRASASASSSAPPPLPPIGSLPQLPTGPLLPAPKRPDPPAKPKFPAPKKPVVTLERKAVDAVIEGNYKEAIVLYEQLAKEHPETPIYGETLRILKGKQNEGK
jgi:hypothetical protein